MHKGDARWPLESPHHELVRLLRETANVVRQGENSAMFGLKDTNAGWVCAIYSTRCAKNLRAVAILCESGFAPEAAHLIRAMLEDAVTVAYIAEDEESRGKQYVDFEEVRSYHYISEALRGGLIDRESDRARQLTEQFADQENLNTLWWAGCSPGGIAGKLTQDRQLKADFFGMYPLLSDDAHGNAMAARNYVVQDDDGKTIALADTPTIYRIQETACLAIYCAWRLTEAAAICGLAINTDNVRSIFEQASEIYRSFEPAES